ncbi:MAG: hypothetical protein HF314_00620 [Ignavibacteria bacterium]|jgi:hypothetical protein|nr:hypothetical protein [Ignavibacteria bacterium]MCU7501553.1 hypothetical protein [Ignavibacteria bacterium]MCU7517090.1 hypothetical protein [Ignavibacteria bacterium]
MGTNKIAAAFIILFLAMTPRAFAQAEYVPYNHPSYDFLERMNSLHFIQGFNDFERPLTRKLIADYIRQLLPFNDRLDNSDRKLLTDFQNEFEYELSGTLKNSRNLIADSTHSFTFLWQGPKYLYSFADSGKASVFFDFLADYETISENSFLTPRENLGGTFLRWGGTIRGTFLDKFGFYIKGTNGKLFGSKKAARSVNELKFNYKLNAGPNLVTASDYFDNSEGYLSADFGLVRFKIGRDQNLVGYGPVRNILGDNAPQYDYLSLAFNYKFISFSYLHAKLLGSLSHSIDSLQGEITTADEKYMGYHRLGLNISRDFSIGLGELVVYSRRSIDLSYLNPFNFYKSTEHANQDRDNSMLFFDVANYSIKGLKLAGSVFIDDIDFGKIGSGWYGNQTAYDLYLRSFNLYGLFPLDFAFEYLRVEPYVFTHRITDNNFTNMSYSLADPILPNSDMFLLALNYRPGIRLSFKAEVRFSRHGANLFGADGRLVRNFGGDVNYGYRLGDPTEVHFLEGEREYYRMISFSSVFEPVKNYYISGRVLFQNNSLKNIPSQKFLAAYFLINIGI